MTGLAAVLSMNVFSPDALVARANVERMHAGERFDPSYLTHLSADAVPILVQTLPSLDEEDRSFVQRELESSDRWRTENADWRTGNLSRFRAHHLVETRLLEGDEVKRR